MKSKQSQNQVSHWLDYAEPVYGRQMVNDVKSVLKILLLFVPLPLFWALFDQQGSRWTFQATRMNGNIGFMEIKPDQMQVINPLLILVFIPIFDCAIYPCLAKVGLRRPLQKLAAGGILAAVAFTISGLVELKLEKTYPMFPQPNESQVRIFNGAPCNFSASSSFATAADFTLKAMEMKQFSVNVDTNMTKSLTLMSDTLTCSNINGKLNVQPGHSNSFFISGDSNNSIESFDDKVDKTKSGYPNVRVLSSVRVIKQIKFLNNKGVETKTVTPLSMNQFEILPALYTVFADDLKLGEVELLLGGVYTIVISKTAGGNFELATHVITSPNSVHMLWLIPQYVIMTAAEVMFSVTGLEFAYSQAPSTMKSLLQACWLLTVAFGNVIVVVIAEAKIFQSQAYEFFLFAVMMFIDMLIFGLLAMKYKYVTNSDSKDDGDMENGIPIDDKRKTFTNNAFQED